MEGTAGRRQQPGPSDWVPATTGRVSVVERALSQAALFHGMDPEEVSSLTGELNTVELGAGQVFFGEGDIESCFYIILSGKVKLGSRASRTRDLCLPAVATPRPRSWAMSKPSCGPSGP